MIDTSKLIRGADISSAQGVVDFNWLYQQGFRFVIIKCFTGNDGADPYYQHNLAAATQAGLQVACYQFVYPLPDASGHPNRNPIDQANLHYQHSLNQLTLIDIEFPNSPDWVKWGCSANQINDWLATYLNRYQQLSGKRCPVYTYPSFANSVHFDVSIGTYPLWIASYTAQPVIPSPWQDWLFWQDSGGDKLTLPSGIKCDTDYAKDLGFWIT